MIKYFSTLTGRFTLSAIIMHLVMVPILFAGVFYLVETNYTNNFVNQVRNDALILASFSESDNKNALQNQRRIIEEAVENGRLYSAKIVDENNKTIQIWGAVESLASHDEDFFFGEHNDKVFNIIIPRYDNEGNIRGELFLSYDEQPTIEQISQAYEYGIYMTIAYISITFSLTILLGLQVTKPIKQLRKASFDILMGEYNKALHVKTGILDIQQLAKTLEYMRYELVKKNNELHHRAMHDSLTGLPNRLLLRHRIDDALSTIDPEKDSLALLLIDLDHFKEINDTLGHQTGDEVLKIAANRLQSCVRQSDTAARLGGDEFAVILTDINTQNAVDVAQKIADKMSEGFTINNNNKLKVGASIGVAMYPLHGDTFEDIIHKADLAMYVSKLKRECRATLYSEDQQTIKKMEK